MFSEPSDGGANESRDMGYCLPVAAQRGSFGPVDYEAGTLNSNDTTMIAIANTNPASETR
jgi:hypothetical protein